MKYNIVFANKMNQFGVLNREKVPVLLVTHDQQDIDFFANKVSTIQNGQIISDVIIWEKLNNSKVLT